VITSTDGKQWQAVQAPAMLMPTLLASMKVVFGNGLFVIPDYYGVSVSANGGQSWQSIQLTAGGAFDIVYGGGAFWAIGGAIGPARFDAQGCTVYRSSNGRDWEVIAHLDQTYSGLTYGAGRIVLYGGGFNGITSEHTRSISSADG